LIAVLHEEAAGVQGISSSKIISSLDLQGGSVDEGYQQPFDMVLASRLGLEDSELALAREITGTVVKPHTVIEGEIKLSDGVECDVTDPLRDRFGGRNGKRGLDATASIR